MSNQPFSEHSEANIVGVSEPTDLKPILWANLKALMAARWGRENLTRLAKESGVGGATISRIKAQDTSCGIDVLAAMANTLGVEPWQLLVRDMNPASLPRLDKKPLSPQAADLAQNLDRISDPGRLQRAYATAIAVITLAADAAGAPGPTPPRAL